MDHRPLRRLARLRICLVVCTAAVAALAVTPAHAISASGCETSTDATNDVSAAALDLTAGASLKTIGTPDALRLQAFFPVRSLPTSIGTTIPSGALGVIWEVRATNLTLRTTNGTFAFPFLRVQISLGASTPSYEIGYVLNGGTTTTATATGTYQAGTPGLLEIDAPINSLTVNESDVLAEAQTTTSVVGVLATTVQDRAPDSGSSDALAMVVDGGSSCQDQTPATQSTAKSADGFVDSIGVNTHLNFAPSNYRTATNGTENYPSVENALQTAGIRYIRDQLPTSDQTAYLAELQRLASTFGIKLDVITTPAATEPTVANMLPMLRTLASNLVSIEPPNEADGSGTTNGIATRQQDLWTALAADTTLDPIPLLSPSLANRVNYRPVGDLSAYADKGNIHAYAAGEQYTKASMLDSFTYLESLITGSEPVVMTETGYTNQGTVYGPVTEQASGSYIPKTYLTNYGAGVERTYGYELLDEAPYQASDQGNYGLLHSDFTPKPAYTTMKNLISLLADPGAAFTPGTLTQSYSDGTIQHLLLQKRDGTFWLAMWQNARLHSPEAGNLTVADRSVTVTLGAAKAATVYRPAVSTSVYSSSSSSTSLTVTIPATGVVLAKLS